MKFGSGVNVTFPCSSIVYVPSFGTFTDVASVGLPVVGSTNLGAFSRLIGTFLSPSLNVGVPSCGLPWIPSEVAGVAVGVNGVIYGV